MSKEPPETQVLTDYRGVVVRLTAERLGHVLAHPEMVTLADAIAVVLRSPAQVTQSRSDPEVRLYYRHYESTPVGAKWLCVVVKDRPDDAFVITAYLTDRPKKGTRLWTGKS